jgi:hypothetical protein
MTSNKDIASQPPCALWVSARRGHLLRWRSSTMTPLQCSEGAVPLPGFHSRLCDTAREGSAGAAAEPAGDVGLTGGIAAGKSHLAKALVEAGRTQGIAVHNIDLDDIAHDILLRGCAKITSHSAAGSQVCRSCVGRHSKLQT